MQEANNASGSQINFSGKGGSKLIKHQQEQQKSQSRHGVRADGSANDINFTNQQDTNAYDYDEHQHNDGGISDSR